MEVYVLVKWYVGSVIIALCAGLITSGKTQSSWITQARRRDTKLLAALFSIVVYSF